MYKVGLIIGSSDISSDYHLWQCALYLLPSLPIRLQILSVAYSYLRFMLYLESQYIVAWSMHIYIIADKVNNLTA